jgi:gliding-associated putative ABC transporter substrate-binding component GldG
MLRLNSVLQLVAVLVIMVLLNLLGQRHFARLDLTEDRVHTLSQQARGLVGRLEKPLLIKVFFTQGLEAPYNNHERILTDKLGEFRAWSGGRIEIQITDPTGNKEMEQEAARYGIRPIQYRYRSADRQELKQVYMGLALIYGDRQDVLPAITQVQTIEYDLARSIKALISKKDRKKVGYVTGHDEPDLLTGRGPVETLRNRILENHDLVAVDLVQDGLPEKLDALLVIGPQKPLGLRELYLIDQYLMGGGPVAFFVTNFKPDLRTFRALSVYHGLEGLLGHYGFRVDRDLVADRKSNGQMRFPVRQGQYVVQQAINYPLIPKTTDLSKTSLVVRDLDVMMFPFVSSITPVDPNPHGAQVEVLARSTADSGRIPHVQSIHPESYRRRDPAETQGAFPLLVSARGSFTSYFADKPIPDAQPGDDEARIRESGITRLVVAGSADFVANNLTFMQNLVDWMVQDSSLVAIRSKTVQIPTLEHQDARTLNIARTINMVGPAGLLVLVCMVRLFRRRHV